MRQLLTSKSKRGTTPPVCLYFDLDRPFSVVRVMDGNCCRTYWTVIATHPDCADGSCLREIEACVSNEGGRAYQAHFDASLCGWASVPELILDSEGDTGRIRSVAYDGADQSALRSTTMSPASPTGLAREWLDRGSTAESARAALLNVKERRSIDVGFLQQAFATEILFILLTAWRVKRTSHIVQK